MGIIKNLFGKKEETVSGRELFKKDERKNVSVPLQNKGGTVLRKPIDRPIQTLLKKDTVEPVPVEKKPELSALEIADRKEWEVKTLSVWQPGDLILDTYEVENVISGGMGHVYIANHNKWNIKIAIKSPNEMMLSEKDFFARIIREAQAWTELGLHPNIAYCYYVRNIEDVPHIIIEYVDGGNLKDWIEDGKCLDYKTNYDLAIQFCHGMELSHSKGMIHRDIKPANVLMTKDGILKITDFGLVRAGKETAGKGGVIQKQQPAGNGLTMIGDFMGTEGYLSPEQAESAAEVDERTDIFSFGICLYEMFTGNKPYDITYGPKQEAPDPIKLSKDEKFPLRLAELLIKTVQWDKNDRYKSFKDLREELNSIYKEIYQKDNPYYDLDLPDMEADNLNNQGMSYMELGNKNKARECFEKAVGINSIHPQAIYNLSLIQWRNAEIDDSEVLKRVKNCQNNPSIDKEILAELIANIHLERFASKKAEEVLKDYPEKYKQFKKKLKMPNIDCIRTFVGHINDVHSVSLSPNGKFLLSGSSDNTLKLWEVSTGKCIRSFGGDTGLTSVSLGSENKFALSGSDKTMKLWEINTGKCVRTFEHYGFVEFVSLHPENKLALSRTSRDLTLWDIKTGKPIRTFNAFAVDVYAASFSPDGRYVLSGGKHLKKTSALMLWETKTGRCVKTFDYRGIVESLSFRSDGKYFLTGVKNLKIWETETGKCTRTFERYAFHVSFSSDGRFGLFVSRDSTLKLLELETGRCVRSFEGHTKIFTSTYFSLGNNFFISGSKDNTIKRWDIPSKKSYIAPFNFSKSKGIKELKIEKETLSLVKDLFNRNEYKTAYSTMFNLWKNKGFEKDKKIDKLYLKLAQKGFYKAIILLNQHIFKGNKISSFVETISISHDGKLALSGSFDFKENMKLWEIKTGKCLRIFEGHQKTVNSVSFSSDGKFALSGSSDSTLKLWHYKRYTCVRTFKGHTHFVSSVSFSPDGRFLISGSYDKTLRIWVKDTGNCIKILGGHTKKINSVSISPDGKLAISGSGDNTLILWNIITLDYIRTFEGHTNEVCSVSFNSDGKLAISGSYDKTLKLWDIATGKCIHTFEGHTDWVNSVSFSPVDKLAISGSEDKTIKFWDIDTGKCIHTVINNGTVKSLSFSPDGRFVLSVYNYTTLILREFIAELGFNKNSDIQKPLKTEENTQLVQPKKNLVLSKPSLIKPLKIPAPTLIKEIQIKPEQQKTLFTIALDFYLCNLKGERFPGTLQDTLADYTQITHNCPVCNKQASFKRSLGWIFQECINKEKAVFPCISCGKFITIPSDIFVKSTMDRFKRVRLNISSIKNLKISELIVHDVGEAIIAANKSGGTDLKSLLWDGKGSCPGCGNASTQNISQKIHCVQCGTGYLVPQEKISRTQNTTLRCSKCGKYMRIPPTVWCPVCKNNLRSSTDFIRVFKKANQ